VQFYAVKYLKQKTNMMSKMKQNKSYYQDILSKLIEFKKSPTQGRDALEQFLLELLPEIIYLV